METGHLLPRYLNPLLRWYMMTIDTAPLKTIYDIFNSYNVEINSTLEPLHEKLLFLKDGINLIIGDSKAGKTYTTIKTLVDCGFKKVMIHLDFDRNSDAKLKALDVLTYHINDVDAFIMALTDLGEALFGSLKDKILIIDSLQDLSLGDGVDSNQGALKTMQRIQGFKDTGATIIVIHHVTLDKEGAPKVKGNASVITSKCDTSISFIKVSNMERTMKVLNTRAEDKIASGKTITIKDDTLNVQAPLATKPDKRKVSVPK